MNFINKLNNLIKKPKQGIFEISRGKKLFEIWNYYILKYDFSNEEKPFIIIEINQKNTKKENLSLVELKSEKWRYFLKLSNSKNIIFEYSKDKYKTIEQWYSESKSINKFIGNWNSIEIFRFQDSSNISNWIPFRYRDGEFKLKITENEFSIGIPVEYDDTGNGYISFIDGRFELTHNYILVWQNEESPIRLSYNWENKTLKIDNVSISGKFRKE